MSISRIVAILAFVAMALSTGAGLIGALNPKIAATMAAIAAAITAFTERIQGGASKQ